MAGVLPAPLDGVLAALAGFLALGGGDLPATPFFVGDPGLDEEALPGFLAALPGLPLVPGRFFPLGLFGPVLVSLSDRPLSDKPLADPGGLLTSPVDVRAGPLTRMVLFLTFFLPATQKTAQKTTTDRPTER